MMKKHRRSRIYGMVPMLLAAVVLLNACGNTDKKSTKPATALMNATAVGISTCTSCHTPVTADWLTSKHANLDQAGNLYSAGVPTLGQIAGCTINCHDPNGDSTGLTGGYTGNVDRPVVGCEACHGPGSLHAEAGGSGAISLLSGTYTATTIGATAVSGQLVMCTNCHELLDSGGTTTNSSSAHVTTAPTGNAYTITDTHFAEPPYYAIPGSWNEYDGRHDYFTIPGSIAVSGYWMDFADEKVCSNCHNPHTPASINREWAQSAHGERYGAKTGFFSGAWSQYNWSCNSTIAAGCGSSSGIPRGFTACQRCHTTTGFINYADAVRSGDRSTSEAIRQGTVNILLSSGVTDTSLNWKPQMLECNGCHISNRGALRNPGPVTANYDIDVQPAAPATPVLVPPKRSLSSFTYPDLGASNVCMLCHVGRQNGAALKGMNDPALISSGAITSTNFSTTSFTNVHYLTAGATIFTTSGYEYDDRPYNNISAYKHDKIGTSAAPGTGTSGPCVGCHMSRPNKNGNHLFLPVTRDETGVTGIASEVCFNCHGPSSTLILDLVKEQRELYHSAIRALNLQLERREFYFRDFSPYFFQLRLRGNGTLSSPTTVTMASTATITAGTSVGNADYFKFDIDQDNNYYKVKSVDSGTQITIEPEFITATGYDGAILVGNSGAFTIIRGAPSGAARDFRRRPTWYYPAEPTDTDTTGVVSAKNNQGAALNFNMMDHDPGGYVHNRMYVKRLIYDSIDWLDDNNMNYSVGTTLNALNGTTYPWKTGAITYLLPNGIIGIEAERP